MKVLDEMNHIYSTQKKLLSGNTMFCFMLIFPFLRYKLPLFGEMDLFEQIMFTLGISISYFSVFWTAATLISKKGNSFVLAPFFLGIIEYLWMLSECVKALLL